MGVWVLLWSRNGPGRSPEADSEAVLTGDRNRAASDSFKAVVHLRHWISGGLGVPFARSLESGGVMGFLAGGNFT